MHYEFFLPPPLRVSAILTKTLTLQLRVIHPKTKRYKYSNLSLPFIYVSLPLPSSLTCQPISVSNLPFLHPDSISFILRFNLAEHRVIECN